MYRLENNKTDPRWHLVVPLHNTGQKKDNPSSVIVKKNKLKP